MIEVSCPGCDYAENLGIGAGMMGIGLDPMLCGACRGLRAVVVEVTFGRAEDLAELDRCPECGGRELEPVVLLATGQTTSTCPSCEEHDLTWRATGIWD